MTIVKAFSVLRGANSSSKNDCFSDGLVERKLL